MAGTALFILFAIVYAICWPLNRFLLPTRKINPGYAYLAVALLLLLNQIRLAIAQDLGAYVFGVIVGTWLIPTVLALFIAKKFARENPGSIPWGAQLVHVSEGANDKSSQRQEPSWMKD